MRPPDAESGEDRLFADLALATDRQAQPGPAAPLAGDVRERLEDLLRPDSVAQRLGAASRDRGAASIWRAMRPLWLARETAEIAVELDRFDALERARVGSTDPTASGDPFIDLALAADPSIRTRRYRDALEHVARRTPLVDALTESLAAAARRVGAAGPPALADAGSGLDRAAELAAFERDALAPLDDAVGACTRDRWARSASVLIAPQHPADVPAIVALVEHGTLVRADVLRRAIVHAATSLGGAPRLMTPSAPNASGRWAMQTGASQAFAICPGRLEGGTALLHTLAAVGRSVRARFVHELEPLRWRWIDPTFDAAAGALFRRLALDRGFLEACGAPYNERLGTDLRLEAALAPRLAWAYVHQGQAAAGRGRRAFEERIVRAAGRSCWPGEWMERIRDGNGGIERLRGEELALLYEERLLTRFGRRWCLERRARDDLRQLWDAERQASPDDVATAFGLGTIDGATVLERCRP